MDSYNMPKQIQLYCPACGSDLSFATRKRGTIRPPKANDLTVCSHKGCYTYLKYVEVGGGEDGAQLRLDVISREEFEGLPEVLQAGLMQVRGELVNGDNKGPSEYEKLLGAELTALKARVLTLEAAARCECYHCTSGDGLNCSRKRRGA